MQTILLYIAVLNIVMTLLTILFVWGISRFPETPTRPYIFLTTAFLLRAYSQFTGIGFIDDVLKLPFPTTQVVIGTVVSAVISACFLFAYIEKYVLLKKKYHFPFRRKGNERRIQ